MFEDDVKRISLLNKGLNRAKKLHSKTNNFKHLDLIRNIENKLFALDKLLIQKINCKKYLYKRDYEFLDELNTKICSIENTIFQFKKLNCVTYKDYVITSLEFSNIERLLLTDNFILCPLVSNDLILGYSLFDIEKKKIVLTFSRKNLSSDNNNLLNDLIFGDRNIILASKNEIKLF